MTNSLISKLYHADRGIFHNEDSNPESAPRVNDNQSAYCAITNANPMFSHVMKRDYVLDSRKY